MSGRSPRWFRGITPNGIKITIAIGSNYIAALSSYAYVTINGVKYTAAAEIFVPTGTEVIVTVSRSNKDANYANIRLNGTSVIHDSDGGRYTYVAEKPATITLSIAGPSRPGGRAEIVTE